jgi:hypothetical protein
MKIKLLNFTICQIISVIVLINFVGCQLAQSKKQSELKRKDVTPYDRPIERILSRRKRFLVYRPGSNILVSIVWILGNQLTHMG